MALALTLSELMLTTTDVRQVGQVSAKMEVYHVTYMKKSGDVIDAIAVHDASEQECSESGVEVFVSPNI